MPMHEYECNKCKETFYAFMQYDVNGILKGECICPKCHSTDATKQFSVPASRNPEYGIQR